MTGTMQALYNYTLENRFTAFLTGRDYAEADSLAEALLNALQGELPQPQRERLDRLSDALMEQRDLELEAMFQAAWSVAREV
ncbi:hypothetical protein [Dysosmobacter sp. HCP28S3_G4]|uniref:hypothetical protein n=1 Tax=Dysosmobacter sp. HCP28S3_G4 TaxID=3438938 RepID=UPI003F8B4356